MYAMRNKPCLHMDVLSWRLRLHQLWFEGLRVMLGAPRVPRDGRRQQSGKTLE